MALNDDLEKANKELDAFQEELGAIDSQLKSLGSSLKTQIIDQIKDADDVTKDLAKSYSRDIASAISSTSKGLNNYKSIQDQVIKGQDASKELLKATEALQKQQSVTLRKIEFLKREGVKLNIDEIAALEEAFQLDQKILNNLTQQNVEQRKSLGLAGKLADGIEGILNKVGAGGIAKIFNFKQAAADAAVLNRKQFDATGKQVKGFQNLKNLSKSLYNNIDKSALRLGAAGIAFKVAGALFDQYKKADESIVQIAKNLSMSREEAKKLKHEMQESSMAAGWFGVTIHDQKDAIAALNKGLGGTALAFNKDIRVGAAETLKFLGLSEEAVGNMGTLAMATGKSFKQLKTEQTKGMLDAEREFGIRLNLKNVLDEANKITGIARVNALGIDGGLTKAVATAKSLGIEMAAVAGSAGQLLDFESSIQNELAAELMIGRDLNLEKARAAALAGDQEALAKALVEEAGSLEELQGMNVLQQQSLAAALGMSTDQLADALLNQEALSSQAQEGLDRKSDEVIKNEEMLNLSQKQAQAMTKLSETIQSAGNFLAIAAAAAMAIGIGLTLGAGAGPILIGAAAAGAIAFGFTQMVQDGVASPEKGPFTITDSFGATAITAKGDGLAVSPNIDTTGGSGGNSSDMGETNMLLKQILSKEGTVKMDSTNVGTAFSVGSRQIQ